MARISRRCRKHSASGRPRAATLAECHSAQHLSLASAASEPRSTGPACMKGSRRSMEVEGACRAVDGAQLHHPPSPSRGARRDHVSGRSWANSLGESGLFRLCALPVARLPLDYGRGSFREEVWVRCCLFRMTTMLPCTAAWLSCVKGRPSLVSSPTQESWAPRVAPRVRCSAHSAFS